MGVEQQERSSKTFGPLRFYPGAVPQGVLPTPPNIRWARLSPQRTSASSNKSTQYLVLSLSPEWGTCIVSSAPTTGGRLVPRRIRGDWGRNVTVWSYAMTRKVPLRSGHQRWLLRGTWIAQHLSRLGERPHMELGGIRAGAHAFRCQTTLLTWENHRSSTLRCVVVARTTPPPPLRRNNGRCDGWLHAHRGGSFLRGALATGGRTTGGPGGLGSSARTLGMGSRAEDRAHGGRVAPRHLSDL